MLAAMPTAQDKFKELLTGRLAPWFTEQGFKRRDSTFRREREGAWQIVNFQRSKYSDARVVRFTVNLGVALEVLHDEPPWAGRGWPLEYECDFRQRLGPLYKGKDHWWRVRPRLPVGPTAKDVLKALEGRAIGWLDLHADPPRYLARSAGEPRSVTSFNLPSWVSLARKIGTAEDVRVAEEELNAWQRGERPGF